MNRIIKNLPFLSVILVFAGAARADHAEENFPKLSWAPQEYLAQGFGNAPWVRDPFFPSVPAFRLYGIITNEMAFINGSWFKIGESVGQWKVHTVGVDEVVLHQDGRTLQLRLSEQEKSK